MLLGLASATQAQSDGCLAAGLPDSISVHCGGAPSATFDQSGRLWVAFVQDQQVFVSHSSDLGASFSVPVAVNPVPEDAEFNGENRPKILVDQDSTLYVSWTLKTSPRFTGEIRFSRSIDGGSTFSEPRTINDDGLFAGHRFESLFQTESGLLYLTWIDKRDLEASEKAGESYTGAAVYYAVSSDQGKTFSANYRVANHSCECCRIAMAPNGTDKVTILWRHIFGADTRDHAIAVLTPDGRVEDMNRASYDEWHINACPHHGPTMVQSDQSADYHLSWFSNGDLHQGIYYGRYSFTEQQTRDVLRIDGNPGAGHPYLQTFAGTLYLVWKGFDGQQSLINLMTSQDDGRTWSKPVSLMTTVQGSDHPLIVKSDQGLFLSWLTEEKGYIFEQFAPSGEGWSINAAE
jgi:hypothetical protein